MRALRTIALITFLTLFALLSVHTADAQTGDEERFPNGLVVRGEFLKFYRAAPDPWLLFGNPISNEIETNGKRVQYFDRAVMELSNNAKPSKVNLANLGSLLYDGERAVTANIPTNSPTCRFFPKNGHSVCYKLLQFYDANNGPFYFGEPISDAELHDGRIVQYFDNARFEWRPNLPSDLQIGLTDLGRVAMPIYIGINPKPALEQIGRKPLTVTDFQVNAFVKQALVPASQGNTLYVVVQNQVYKPVAGAKVRVHVIFQGGSLDYVLQDTNADGIAILMLPAIGLSPKQIVQLQVTVEYQKTNGTANTWYRIWY